MLFNITRFKQDFLSDLQSMFDNLVDSYYPYKTTYGSMPSHASSNQEIKQLYINGHSCYVYTFVMITNGLGIIKDIPFFNKELPLSHLDITVGKKYDSSDEDKSPHDSKVLIPVLKDFFDKHTLIKPNIFLVLLFLMLWLFTRTCLKI